MCLIDAEEKLVIFCCITVYRVGSAVDCVCKLVMCLINCQNLLNISAPIKTWLLFLLFRAPVIDVAKASSEQCHIVSWRRKLKTDLLNYLLVAVKILYAWLGNSTGPSVPQSREYFTELYNAWSQQFLNGTSTHYIPLSAMYACAMRGELSPCFIVFCSLLNVVHCDVIMLKLFAYGHLIINADYTAFVVWFVIIYCWPNLNIGLAGFSHGSSVNCSWFGLDLSTLAEMMGKNWQLVFKIILIVAGIVNLIEFLLV